MCFHTGGKLDAMLFSVGMYFIISSVNFLNYQRLTGSVPHDRLSLNVCGIEWNGFGEPIL